jgi:hypothetical protein
MHDPDRFEAAAEARELGGKRRRREGTIAGAFNFEGLDNVPRLRRLLEIVGVDLLGLENSIARGRAIISLVQAAAKLLEVGEMEERLGALEETVIQRSKPALGRRSGRA